MENPNTVHFEAWDPRKDQERLKRDLENAMATAKRDIALLGSSDQTIAKVATRTKDIVLRHFKEKIVRGLSLGLPLGVVLHAYLLHNALEEGPQALNGFLKLPLFIEILPASLAVISETLLFGRNLNRVLAKINIRNLD